ncbi:MAG: HEAT repeat domain-containing protein [Planctomycetota bacterium]
MRIEEIVARGSGPAQTPGLARELAALGPRAIPALLEVLALRPRPRDPTPRSSSKSDARAKLHDTPPADPIAESLLAALVEMPGIKLRSALEDSIARDSSARARCAVLRCLGRAGTARDLALVARAACTVAPDEPMADEVRSALVRALLEVLARDPSACGAIEGVYPHVAPVVRPGFLEALGLRAGDAALRSLSRLLHIDADLRARALVEIGRAAAKSSRPVDDDVLANVRRYLVEGVPAGLPEAILAVGYLDDCESIPQLIALLSSEHRGARANAQWSLQRITRLGFRDTPDQWAAWYASEMEWWTRVWPSLAEDLHGRDRTRLRVALAQLGSRNLDRHRLAVEVAATLQVEDLTTQDLACAVLGQLGSSAAVPALIAALEHDDAAIRTSAWSALRKITGLDLPLDAVRWRESRSTG